MILLYVFTCYFLAEDDFFLLVICYYPFRSNIKVASSLIVLAWKRGDEVSKIFPLALLMWSFLAPVVQWGTSVSPPGLGIFTWCLIYGELQLGLLMKETEVGNDLCCYHGDISLSLLPRTLHQKPVK